MPQAVPPRSNVATRDTWATESMFASIESWEEAYARAERELREIGKFRGRLGDGAGVLLEWFEQSQRLQNFVALIYVYAHLTYDVDMSNPVSQALDDRGSTLYAECAAALSFGEPEILKLDPDTLHKWLDENEQLRTYAHFIDVLEARRSHVRNDEVEKLLGLIQEPFSSAEATHGILVDSDLSFQPARTLQGQDVQIAQGNFHALLDSDDREVRRTAWENYSDAHLAVQNTLANVVATGVKHHVFMAKARNYRSSLDASLTSEHIPRAVYDNLIATFQANLSTWHRYWRVRREALGYDRLHVYDIWAPLKGNPPQISYTEAVDLIAAGMQPMGAEYVQTLRRGTLEERWVDIYPNQHKSSGAYSAGVSGTNPFILMSYGNGLPDVSTLAHELGHSLHSYNAWKTQPYIYSEYGTFLAEVASNFNQALVRRHLAHSNPDPNFQIALLEEAMANFHRYFFIMPTLARFELELHERVERGQALTAASMNALMTELFMEGYGEELDADKDRIGITWAEFPSHMYGNFYVWQYATGIAGAQALATRVLSEGPAAAEDYLKFLRAGSSMYPLDVLRLAGVDMTSPEPVEIAFGILSDTVERLAELTSKKDS